MAENNTPQSRQDDDLSVEELDEVAGGAFADAEPIGVPNTNCGTNCHCE